MAKKEDTPSGEVRPEKENESIQVEPSEATEVTQKEQEDSIEQASENKDSQDNSSPVEEPLADSFFEKAPDDPSSASIDDVEIQPGTFEGEVLWGSEKDPVIPPNWQPILPLCMVVLSLFVMVTFYGDFQYFFSPRTPMKLGSIKEGCPSSFYKRLPHNRLVHIGGIFAQPGMTAEARVRWHKQNYIVAMGCNLIVSMRAEDFKRVSMQYFGTTGRLVRASDSGVLEPIKQYYAPSGIMPFGKNTYILYASEHPNHQWWLLVMFIFLGVLLIYNVRSFVRLAWSNWSPLDRTEGH